MTTPTDRIREALLSDDGVKSQVIRREMTDRALSALCDSHDLFLSHVRAYGPERFRRDYPDVAAGLANIGDRVARAAGGESDG